MKRLFIVCLALMMMAGTSLKAQEVTITLNPGWTWISYPKAEAMDIATAFSDFAPMEGDIVKSQYGAAEYYNGSWTGSLQEFTPGLGYMYCSTRVMPVTFVFGGSAQSQVLVTTSEPMLVTGNSAMGGGEVTTEDGIFVLAKGLCWATHENPTTNEDYFLDVGSGVGSFTASMTALNISTTYYVRAYAVTPNGTAYGDQKTFTTRDGIPSLTTAEVTDITGESAITGGNITDNGGLAVTARGVCWSISPNPTIADSHTTNGSGTGSFSSSITGLNVSTTYYVRAYATNSYVTVYGNQRSFITEAGGGSGGGNAPTGAIDGKFTINSNGDQVYFSQGNLQYQASTNIWKFADNQYDYVGSTNSNISSTYNGWIDLFGWGTSGNGHGANAYQPWSTSTNYDDYYAYGMHDFNLYDGNGQADWGYNAISNGFNIENCGWRTLTWLEWDYVINNRTTASGIRYAEANVNNVNGIILLPDNWNSSIYSLNYTNATVGFMFNVINSSQWSTLEQAGAVFLPAAGDRYGILVESVGEAGYYWSSSFVSDDVSGPWNYCFGEIGPYPGDEGRPVGNSVRLVRNAE